MSAAFSIHVRTVTGLEDVLALELEALGAKDVQILNRLVMCTGDLRVLYSANIFCRTAIRVLRPLLSFPARDEKALYEGIRKIDWSQWMEATSTLAIDADVRSSFTTHSLYLAQLAKDAIVDQFRDKIGERPSVDLERPDIRIVVSLFQDTAQIYLDSSGESLHKRGYRKKTGEAPISEVLAAGILKLTGWDGSTPLIDPMCGSGTFGIEAGLIVRNIAPGLLRKHFAFQRWPDFDSSLYDELIQSAKNSVKHGAEATVIGVEKDPGIAQVARENVERAGLSDLVRIETGDFFAWDALPQTPGTVVMNPPYDERLPVDNIAELYQSIGDRLKKAYGGWTAFVLSGNLEAVKYFGLRSSSRILLYNGSIETRLLKYELRAASPKAEAPKWRVEAQEVPAKWKEKSDVFKNRLTKNVKNLSKWAKRENTECYRLYNWDIPELAFIVDVYGDRLHFAEIERNHDHSPIEHKRYIELMIQTAGQAAGVERNKTYYKKRKPQVSGGFQYAPHDETGELIEVHEGGHTFLVNLADYLDVGLFLDHRKTRKMIEKEAKGKDFLNLFAYTGSFSVYAARGGAKSTMTVDTSKTYLEWAEKNFAVNALSGEQYRFLRSDVIEFLERTGQSFDLCVVDPPTRSVNKSSGRTFDVQADHVALLHLVLKRMRPGGRIYFSNNYRTFSLDEVNLIKNQKIRVKEITAQTTSPDFEKKPNHRAWLIEVL